MKWIDLPPVWLLGCLVLAWVSPLTFAPGFAVWIGWAAIAVGVLLTGLAVIAFLSAKTTIIPRHDPNALITHGIFARTRNPIYLADVLFLFGASLIWGAWVGLVLVPLFVWMLTQRFITGEEAVLRDAYGADFTAYCARVRRWI